MTDLIDVHQSNGVLVTTSRNVAEVFGKRHADVLRDVENVISQLPKEQNADLRSGLNKPFGQSPDLGSGLNKPFEQTSDLMSGLFIVSTYQSDPNGRSYPEYLITKDGLTLLVMGYTGEKAMAFKLAYIQRFNEMEALLQEKILENQEVDLDRLHKEVLLTADALKAAGYTPTKVGLALNELMLKATGKDYFAIMGVHLEEPEPKEEELLTPTEIGAELGMSNRVVNQLLKKVGLQYKPENSHLWFPTEKGIEHGAKVLNVCKKSSIGTTTQLKWSTKVISILRNYLE